MKHHDPLAMGVTQALTELRQLRRALDELRDYLGLEPHLAPATVVRRVKARLRAQNKQEAH
jgi:hypothetical protein